VTLWKLDVLIETDDPARVDRLREAIEPLLCPHEGSSRHRCPNRWFILAARLDERDAAKWEPLLNE
jgi:hypothetical protein